MFSHEKEVSAIGFTSTAESPGQLVRPDISPTLELALTIVYTLLYTFLFVFVYVQLWLILHHGHKRFSYQSVLLFLCLLWAALRTTLFSFYFENVAQANRLQPFPYWLLYCCPVCLQFFTLCLLNLYFTQVMFKAKAKYSPELTKYKVPLRLVFLCLSVLFLVVNLTCALMIQSAEQLADPASAGGVRRAVLARVLVNDSLFVLCAVSLSVCIFRIAKMSSANVYLESKGTSVRQATAIGSLIILLFTSRACYNLAVVALAPEGPATPFSYGWFSVSDQADVQQVSGETYVVFGVVLLLWELLPTSLLVGFFRVQQPNLNLAPGGMINSQSFSSRAYLFDNPRRYDSEDDLTRSITSRSDRASLLSTAPQTGPPTWYGSVPRTGSLTGVGGHPPTLTHPTFPSSSANAPATTAPLLFAYPGSQGPHHIHHHHHHNFYSTPQNNNGCRHLQHPPHQQQQQQQSHHCSTPQNQYCGSQNYYCTPTN
ncbi:integral membrane protein GPR137C [Gadus chalcogrammus]|uniref:integral membrane protein GPR137C n=1 Tax=Gadus chalcogrammus TaxID=1042646 RepID=UPI0024C29DF2|nr:integral membrane protein GPR137C [Gadus chalcogrammus]